MTDRDRREATAIKKIDDSADVALIQLKDAAALAKKTIEDACQVTVRALEQPEKRKINGSYQWEPYRRGSDDRIQRLEEKVDEIDRTCGDLEVGQATRHEQITTIQQDCRGILAEFSQFKGEHAHSIEELSNRLTTIRELMLEIKDTLNTKIDANYRESQQDKIKTQNYIIGITVGIIITFISGLVFGYYRL